jgi:hypothetical protein
LFVGGFEMLREWSLKFGLVFASLFLGILLLEVGLRFFVPLPSPFMLPDSRLIFDQRGFWLNLPNQRQVFSNRVDFNNAVVSTDNNGLRHVPCRIEKSGEEVPRIYIIGDSQTYGWGISDDESWPNQLQCLLNQSGQKYAVYNLGVPGTNLDQYYYRTRMIYDFVRKGDVLVYVMTWNDWHSDQSSVRAISLSGKCDASRGNAKEPIFCPVKPLRYYGLQASWRKSFYDRSGFLFPAFDSVKAFTDTVVFSSAVAFLAVPPLKALFLRFRSSDTLKRIGPSIPESNRKLMVQIAADTKKSNHTQFVFLPSRISYADSIYNVYSKGGRVFKNQDFLFEMGKATCTKNDLYCYSLFPALHTSEMGTNEFSFDGHLNARGAKLVAQSVLRQITRSLDGSK